MNKTTYRVIGCEFDTFEQALNIWKQLTAYSRSINHIQYFDHSLMKWINFI